jgi:hypothetical protein
MVTWSTKHLPSLQLTALLEVEQTENHAVAGRKCVNEVTNTKQD